MARRAAGRPDDGVPMYLRIAEALRREIVLGRLAPGARLPSEHQLAEKYGVARETIRRALGTLQEDALVTARRAVGTFVAEPGVDQQLDALFSFSEVMVHRGLKPGARLLAAELREVSTVDSPILSALRLRVGERVVCLRRLRLGNNEPLVIATTYLPDRLFPGFLKHRLRQRHVYDIMDRDYGRKPDDASQTFEAVTLGSEDARLLGVAPGSSALLVTRTGFSAGVPVEYATDYYRGDRTRFRARLGHIG